MIEIVKRRNWPPEARGIPLCRSRCSIGATPWWDLDFAVLVVVVIFTVVFVVVVFTVVVVVVLF